MKLICPDCGHKNIPGEDACESCSAPLAPLTMPRPKDVLCEKILSGTIADIPPRKALAVGPDASLAEAVRLMRENRACCVMVTQKGEVRGMLGERDLLFAPPGARLGGDTPVSELMHAFPVCLDADDPVAFAFHHMAVGRYHVLPVRLPDGTVGAVRVEDLMRYLAPREADA
ncbi:MAG: CBS domain-containing protein [Elusimicrobiota bacterium]